VDLGIFTTTFVRSTLEVTFDAVATSGLHAVQFNLSSAGAASLPDEIAPALVDRVRRAASSRDIEIAAVSGTFNMAHPDATARADGVRRLGVLLAACRPMGASVVTICTGTRDREDMWRWHRDNETPGAWRDLIATLGEALTLAETAGVTLAFEPERANLVDTPAKAAALLREMGSDELKVVIDAANLIDPGEEARLPAVLDEAFAVLGDRIVLAHAKDRTADGTVVPAGMGVLPWDRYLELLQRVGYRGPLVMHGLDELEVPASMATLRRSLATANRAR